jgi:predicted RNase H-like HicB family nuclease
MTVPVQVDLRTLRYAIVVRPDRYDDGSIAYIAEIPELPGCKAHGSTVEEAQQNILEAQREYLEALVAEKLPIPPPTPTPTSTAVFWTVSVASTITSNATQTEQTPNTLALPRVAAA